MFGYQKRSNTANYIKLNSNNFIPQKPQGFRDIYINQSPTFFNQYRYDIEGNISNIPRVQYVYKQRRPFEYYSNDDRNENFNNSLSNPKPGNDYFINRYKYTKKDGDIQGRILQHSVNNMTSPNPRKTNEIYYLGSNRRVESSSQERSDNVKSKKLYQNYSFNENSPKNKLYIKNPVLKNDNYYTRKTRLEKQNNNDNAIAQKICNIIIQGETKKSKNKKNEKKIKIYSEIEKNKENLESNRIQTKKIKLNQINNNKENYKKEENEEENENEEFEEKENYNRNENENYFLGKEDGEEEYEDEENVENADEYYIENNNDNNDITKENDEQEEQYEQYEEENEQEEQMEEDENNNNENNVKDEEHDEIEEDEQFQDSKNYSKNKINKNIYYKLQKENEIELNGINYENKNRQLNIIKDDNIEIHGKKKPQILEINTESNIELINKRDIPIIEIQKIQNYEQPRAYERKSNKKRKFKISKNKENNVDIIHIPKSEPTYQIQQIQNFKQQRTKERNSEKKRNNIKKYKITKIKESNLFIEKTESNIEPILEIQRINEFNHINQNRKENKRNNKKNINKYKIDKIKDSNLFLEKIETEPKIEIQKVNDYYQKRSKEKIIKRKRTYRLKIEKQKNCNIEIKILPSIAIQKQENLLLKNKYTIPKKKKTDYKKLKKSKRDIYQYRVTQKKENEINISKENRFIIKGKPKKLKKKIKNSIKREVIYFYKSSIIPKKTELSIGGNIHNTISPNIASEKIETEGNIMKLISPENSSRGKDEIDINLNQNHIIGVSPAKEEITQKYKSNTFSNSLNINNNENKENIISIDQLKGEKKTYISPRRLRQSNKNKKEEKAKENITIPQKKYNTADINDKEKYKTDDSKVNSNVYYSTSFRIPKKEKNKTVDNNTMFISARSSSSSQSHYRNDKSDKQNEMKNNMNRISINSSSSSPVVLRNTENSRIKTENENINKINLKPEKEEIKNEVKKEVEENKQTEKKLELNNNTSNEPLSMTTSKVKETETNNYNFLVNFNNIDSQELSEYTKAYLNSYMSASRPELSDFSKQFLISTEINESTTKPELSNITRAYLFSQNAPEEGK